MAGVTDDDLLKAIALTRERGEEALAAMDEHEDALCGVLDALLAAADALRARAEAVRADLDEAIEEHEALDEHLAAMQMMAVRIAEKRRAGHGTYEIAMTTMFETLLDGDPAVQRDA